MSKKQMTAILLSGILLTQAAMLGACAKAGQGAEPQAQTQQQESTERAAETADEEAAGEETADTGLALESEPGDTENGGITAEEKQDGINGFAFRLTKELLSQKEPGENLIASPYSVWLPLAALVNASDEAAKVDLLSAVGKAGIDAEELNESVKELNAALMQEELAAYIREDGGEFESPLKIANALFVGKDEAVKQEFAALFEQYYAGKLFSVDFREASAVKEVNDWAAEQTEGKITDIIDSFDPQTIVAAANAIYFSDAWAKEFPETETKEEVFHGSVMEETVPFMNSKFTGNQYYEDDDMQAVILRTMYNGQFILCLPKEGKNAEELLAGMDTEKLSGLQESDSATVQLSLPRFKLESGVFSVKEAIELLGVPLTDGDNPHLDGLVEGNSLFISQAVQKAMIEVDEKGLTAAAVTVMGLEGMSMPVETEPVEMKCNRPFFFLLTADGGEAGSQILFTGVVNRIAELTICK